jgi:antitoxin (DNA-binding transcriptional repressor) of toxin-antitoxin stability system
MQWAELRPYHTGGPGWLRDIAKSIEQNRGEVESELNRRMGLDTNPDERMRLGLVDSKLYIRRQDTSEYNWMNMYRNELVYFRSLEEKKAFIEEARDRLGIQGNTRLSQLMEQITDLENITNTKHGGPVYDLTNIARHLQGYSLGMMLDTNNQRIQDIQPKIERIGREIKGGHGIENPQFPEGNKRIESMYASMLGAGLSDGHVEKTSNGFVYTEKNRRRVEIVNKQVDQFGDVYRHEEILENGVIRTRYSSTFGRLLENRGLTKGDKTLQNEGWPDWMKEVPSEALTNYYGSLWAEDGCFVTEKGGHRVSFSVDRGTVEMAKLVRDRGDESKEGPFGGLFKLSSGTLKELENSPDAHISQVAQQLRGIVKDKKPQLMMDEKEGLAKLGIKTSEYFLNLTYSENTERLSTLWRYQTSTKDDAMRVAIKCPPDDEVKRAKVEKWMWSESESERRERVQSEIGGVNDDL